MLASPARQCQDARNFRRSSQSSPLSYPVHSCVFEVSCLWSKRGCRPRCITRSRRARSSCARRPYFTRGKSMAPAGQRGSLSRFPVPWPRTPR